MSTWFGKDPSRALRNNANHLDYLTITGTLGKLPARLFGFLSQVPTFMLRLARRACWRTLFLRRALSTEAYSDTYDGSLNPPSPHTPLGKLIMFCPCLSLRHWRWPRRLRGRDGCSTNGGSDFASDAEDR